MPEGIVVLSGCPVPILADGGLESDVMKVSVILCYREVMVVKMKQTIFV